MNKTWKTGEYNVDSQTIYSGRIFLKQQKTWKIRTDFTFLPIFSVTIVRLYIKKYVLFLGVPSLGFPSINPVEVKEFHIEEDSFAQHYYDAKLYGYLQAKVSNAQ